MLRLLPKILKITTELKYKHDITTGDVASSSRKKRKSVKKLTELEQADSWIKHFNTAEAALVYIKDRRTTYGNIEGNLKFQLMISLIGPTVENSDIIIFFDNFQYKVDSISQAISTSFQMFFVFNSFYTLECENCWKLIQTHFYKIIEENQSIHANVIDLRIQIEDFINQPK